MNQALLKKFMLQCTKLNPRAGFHGSPAGPAVAGLRRAQ
jgi:hypothetical protein